MCRGRLLAPRTRLPTRSSWRAVHVADTTAPRLDPNLEQYLKRAFMLKRSNERVFAMLESSEAPTIYNVWRMS